MAEHYKKRYGQWAGNAAGREPDFTRCCADLHDRWHPGGYQCTRPATSGPDGAYCKQHDPDAVKARREKSDREYKAKQFASMKQLYGPNFLDALRKIADGHNDPRALAKEIVDKFDKDFAPQSSAPDRGEG